jgi:subtilisin family serine protease
MRAAHVRMARAITSAAGVSAPTSVLENLGIFTGQFSMAEARKLQAAATTDRRILAVEENRIAGKAQLVTSTTTVNIVPYANAGYRAAGQFVAVLDNGTQGNHEFFKNASGTSRASIQGCYGTNINNYGGVNYKSVCPSPNSDGDSPPGTAGSAEPVPNCSSKNPYVCGHGTHVAGIAAGLQGTAPDATIVPIQVFSFDISAVEEPSAFVADILKALELMANLTAAGTLSNPITINLSLGGDVAVWGDCSANYPSAQQSIQKMFSWGVPVVAASGNSGYNNRVTFPACMSKIIKVASVNNDAAGITRSSFSNLVLPSSFPADPNLPYGQYFFLAPGGGSSTYIRSANYSTTSTTQNNVLFQGTSQAAPHVAGLFAVLKAAFPTWSVSQIGEALKAYAVPVTTSVCTNYACSSSQTISVPRVRMP